MLKAFPPWSCRICTSCSAVAVIPCNQFPICITDVSGSYTMVIATRICHAIAQAMHRLQMRAKI